MTTISINTSNRSKKQTAVRILQTALKREKKILKAGLEKTQNNLKNFENTYDMTSQKFYELYKNGQIEDRNDFVDWAGEYQIYESLKEQINVLKEIKV